MIEELRLRNELLLSKCVDKKDTTYLKLKVIKNILVDDKCFFKMNIDDAYNILNDLGYSDDDALNAYKMLIKYDNYINIDEF